MRLNWLELPFCDDTTLAHLHISASRCATSLRCRIATAIEKHGDDSPTVAVHREALRETLECVDTLSSIADERELTPALLASFLTYEGVH